MDGLQRLATELRDVLTLAGGDPTKHDGGDVPKYGQYQRLNPINVVRGATHPRRPEPTSEPLRRRT